MGPSGEHYPSCPVEMYHSDDGRAVGPCAEGCYPDPCYSDQKPVPPGRVICRRGHVLTRSLLKQPNESPKPTCATCTDLRKLVALQEKLLVAYRLRSRPAGSTLDGIGRLKKRLGIP